MTIETGQRIPACTLRVMGEKGPEEIDAAEFFQGRKVVMFALPGAFTPTCSARHLPGFIDHYDDFMQAGIDTVACLSVNDAFVMDAWGKSAGAGDIVMLADGNGDFSTALGLETDASAWGMGLRCRRFALVADDGLVTHLFIEGPGEFMVSSAEHVLGVVQGQDG